MSVAELLADLTRLGIEVVVHRDRLRYRPRSAVTPDLMERLRELLSILQPSVVPHGANPALLVDKPDVAGDPIQWEDCIDPPGAAEMLADLRRLTGESSD